MSHLDPHIVEDYLAAWHADDVASIHQLLGALDDVETAALLDEVAVRLAVLADSPPLDPERLHTALRGAGFDAHASLRWSQLAEAEPNGYLDACMRSAATDLNDAASSIVESLPELSATDLPAVRRYLSRILDGRHDVRRVQQRVLESIADACAASRDVLGDLATRASAPAPRIGLAAARSEGADEEASFVLRDTGTVGDVVDQLFCDGGHLSPPSVD